MFNETLKMRRNHRERVAGEKGEEGMAGGGHSMWGRHQGLRGM